MLALGCVLLTGSRHHHMAKIRSSSGKLAASYALCSLIDYVQVHAQMDYGGAIPPRLAHKSCQAPVPREGGGGGGRLGSEPQLGTLEVLPCPCRISASSDAQLDVEGIQMSKLWTCQLEFGALL